MLKCVTPPGGWKHFLLLRKITYVRNKYITSDGEVLVFSTLVNSALDWRVNSTFKLVEAHILK